MADMNINEDAPDGYNMCPCIYLNDDQVEALGIKEPPAPGTQYVLRVVAVATRVTATAEEPEEQATEGSAPDVSLELRLTDIEIQSNTTVRRGQAAALLYG